jgi:cardiolipin synthase
MQRLFAEDWAFTTRELLEGLPWFPAIQKVGECVARGVPDGPDAHIESFRHAILGAIACAEHSIRIATPYFLPDASLIAALSVAALRGMSVDVLLPGKNNIALVHWATRALLWQIAERGCRIWMTPAPFDHTKMMVVDGFVSLVGSSNWDPRSLRLNFEFNLECYNETLAANLSEVFDERVRCARRVTLEELDNRSLPIKLRDGLARLASPYL